MGDNTFRYSPGAPGVEIAGGGRGDRKKRAAAGLAGHDAGGRDMAGRDAGGRDAGGRDMAGRDTASHDAGGRDSGRRDAGGRGTGPAGQGGVGLLAGVRDESDRRTGGADDASRPERGANDGASHPGRGASDTASHPERGARDIGIVAAAPVPAEPSATYWRRRFIILAAGLAVLAAGSWGLSQALQVHPAGKSPNGTLPTSRSSSGPRAGTTGAAGQRGASAGSQNGHSSGGSAGQSGAGTATGPSAAPKPTVTTSGFAGFKPAFCSWHSIVLSLSASQVQFGSGQEPAFSLSVVSTQPTDCSFNVGPGHLAVVIKEGPARIWSSADCVNGTGSLVTALRRGVPTVIAIDWNRRTSSPGCSGPARAVPAGSYTAYAVEGSIVSPPVTLRLS